MDAYWIEECETQQLIGWKLVSQIKYNVVRSKAIGLCGLGTYVEAQFETKHEADLYAEELNYKYEQSCLEYEKQEKPKTVTTRNRAQHERYVQDAYNDWERAHR